MHPCIQDQKAIPVIVDESDDEWCLEDAIDFVKRWGSRAQMIEGRPHNIDDEMWKEILDVYDLCQLYGYNAYHVTNHWEARGRGEVYEPELMQLAPQESKAKCEPVVEQALVADLPSAKGVKDPVTMTQAAGSELAMGPAVLPAKPEIDSQLAKQEVPLTSEGSSMKVDSNLDGAKLSHEDALLVMVKDCGISQACAKKCLEVTKDDLAEALKLATEANLRARFANEPELKRVISAEALALDLNDDVAMEEAFGDYVHEDSQVDLHRIVADQKESQLAQRRPIESMDNTATLPWTAEFGDVSESERSLLRAKTLVLGETDPEVEKVVIDLSQGACGDDKPLDLGPLYAGVEARFFLYLHFLGHAYCVYIYNFPRGM